jgi:MerR family transcriptional regulator, redox-sensitive transcriptional activator SoxR
MAHFTISDVARQVGLRPSAIRYYEKLGILAPPSRVGGQRRYSMAAVHQLAVLRRAQEAGFTLDEVRELFFGLGGMSARWKKVADRKIAELDARIQQIQTMKDLLHRLRTRCHCETVEQCGAGILSTGIPHAPSSKPIRRA